MQLPDEVISKILTMRPPHPTAGMIKDIFKTFEGDNETTCWEFSAWFFTRIRFIEFHLGACIYSRARVVAAVQQLMDQVISEFDVDFDSPVEFAELSGFHEYTAEVDEMASGSEVGIWYYGGQLHSGSQV